MKRHTMWKGLKKNRKVISGLFIVVVCLGLVTAYGGVLPSQKAARSNENIPQHDGDVLVDSINVNNTTATQSSRLTSKAPALVTSDNVGNSTNSDNSLEEMRATITMDRNQVISMLTDAEAQAGSPAEKESDNQQKLKILHYMEQEQNVETIIQSKGLPQCLVLISDNGVNVTVNKQDLTQSDVAKICDIIMRETGRKAPEIVIQSKF